MAACFQRPLRCSATRPGAASIRGRSAPTSSNRVLSGWHPPTIAAATTPATWVLSASPRFARGSAQYGFFSLVSRRGRGRHRTDRLEGPTLGNAVEHPHAVPHRHPAYALHGRSDLLCLLRRGFIAGDRRR